MEYKDRGFDLKLVNLEQELTIKITTHLTSPYLGALTLSQKKSMTQIQRVPTTNVEFEKYVHDSASKIYILDAESWTYFSNSTFVVGTLCICVIDFF